MTACRKGPRHLRKLKAGEDQAAPQAEVAGAAPNGPRPAPDSKSPEGPLQPCPEAVAELVWSEFEKRALFILVELDAIKIAFEELLSRLYRGDAKLAEALGDSQSLSGAVADLKAEVQGIKAELAGLRSHMETAPRKERSLAAAKGGAAAKAPGAGRKKKG